MENIFFNINSIQFSNLCLVYLQELYLGNFIKYYTFSGSAAKSNQLFLKSQVINVIKFITAKMLSLMIR